MWSKTQQPLSTNKLMRRLLRFVSYNTDLYVAYRECGQYAAAAARLRRAHKLITLVDRVIAQGADIAQPDWVNVRLLDRHIGAMVPALGNPPGF